MKRIALVVVLAVAAVTVWFRSRPAASGVSVSVSVGVSDPKQQTLTLTPTLTNPVPPQHVREIDPPTRTLLANRIAASRAAHASRPPTLPSLDPNDGDTFRTTLRAAMREVIPHIEHCYEQALPTLPPGELVVPADLELRGDPDVGTLIDAHRLHDAHGAELPAELDSCLRDALQSLELPPLAEGDEVRVTYPFTFRSE